MFHLFLLSNSCLLDYKLAFILYKSDKIFSNNLSFFMCLKQAWALRLAPRFISQRCMQMHTCDIIMFTGFFWGGGVFSVLQLLEGQTVTLDEGATDL